MKIMTVIKEEVLTNPVPAVAVIQGGLALFLGTWRKAYVGVVDVISLEILYLKNEFVT